ncbi:MAG: hypothetical protein PHC61_05030 [Chitinivibrionales bacterium]|nr:hypothetical protein [Chitinivibrionales bacterium]
MASAIQIRNVPKYLYGKLKSASKAHHRSISGEALAILEAAVEVNEYPRNNVLRSIDAVRETIEASYGRTPSSTAMIRQDRDR